LLATSATHLILLHIKDILQLDGEDCTMSFSNFTKIVQQAPVILIIVADDGKTEAAS
jgi:hypothetical protein